MMSSQGEGHAGGPPPAEPLPVLPPGPLAGPVGEEGAGVGVIADISVTCLRRSIRPIPVQDTDKTSNRDHLTFSLGQADDCCLGLAESMDIADLCRNRGLRQR